MSEFHGVLPWDVGRFTPEQFNALSKYESDKKSAADKARKKAGR